MSLNRRIGFTLVELLCVIGIIAVLAALLLGPVHRAFTRAKRMEWELKAGAFIERVTDRLREHHVGKTSYPAASIEELSRRRVFDDFIMGVFRSEKDKVEYFPFSSADSNEKIILKVQASSEDIALVTKKQATQQPE